MTSAGATGWVAVAIGAAVETGGLTTTATWGGATATAGRAGEETAPAGGRAITGPEGGRVPIAGEAGGGAGCMIEGAWRGCGTILRGSGLAAMGGGVASRGVREDAEDAGRATTAPDAPEAVGEAGIVEAGGRTTTDGAAGGRPGNWACRSASCFLAKIAFSTSPGLEILERSILGRFSCSLRELAPPEPAGREPRSKYPRTRSASPASMELEWVLPSAIPIDSRASRICLLLTSSSRARSLIRTLLIRLFSLSYPCRLTGHSNLTAIPALPIAIIL
jgi:hypothetical protein